MLVIGDGEELDASSTECLFGYGETIGVAGHHTYHLEACLTQGIDRLQGRAACGNQVFYDDYLGTFRQFTFYLVPHTMIFRFGSYIYIRQVQLIGHQGTLCNGTCSHTSHSLGLRELLQNHVGEGKLHHRTQFRVREGLAVIGINRRFPSAGPGKGLVGLELYSFHFQEFPGKCFL